MDNNSEYYAFQNLRSIEIEMMKEHFQGDNEKYRICRKFLHRKDILL